MDQYLDYKKIARTIAEKFKENLNKTITPGQAPDLYWKLEDAIVEALKYVDKKTAQRIRSEINELIKDFDEQNGTSSN